MKFRSTKLKPFSGSNIVKTKEKVIGYLFFVEK